MARCFRVIALILLAAACAFAASKPYSGTPAKSFPDGADGTSEHPYIIRNAEELVRFANIVNDTNLTRNLYYAELADDIVFNEGDATEWGSKAPKYTWNSIGSKNELKEIHFNGNGHSISGIFVNNKLSHQGFFGNVSGVISNLTLKNSFVKGETEVGALVGRLENEVQVTVQLGKNTTKELSHAGCVENVHAEGVVVQGVNFVGGIVGYSIYPCFKSVSFDGSVKGGKNVGGVAGYLESDTSEGSPVFENIRNFAEVVGRTCVGGISGVINKGTLSELRYLVNHGNVKGDTLVGGIVGSFSVSEYDGSSRMIRAYFLQNMGDVTGIYEVGGFYGFNWYQKFTFDYDGIFNSYNAGTVKGESYVGIYYGESNISKTYTSLQKSYNFGKITQGDSLIAPKIDAMDAQIYCDSLGPDFVPDTGSVPLNGGYPLLIGDAPDGTYLDGEGTEENPFVIASEYDFYRFGAHASAYYYKHNHHYKQMTDINWTSKTPWKPVTMDSVVYDGNSHKISNLLVDAASGGLFGLLDSCATLRNISLENVDVTAEHYAAGLAGYVSENSVVQNIKVSGSVKAVRDDGKVAYAAAGVVAAAGSDVLIENCENLADVDASGDYVAGILGYNSNINGKDGYRILLKNVVNRGNITGKSYVAGVVGQAFANIIMAKNFGTVVGTTFVGGVAADVNSIKAAFNRGPVSGNKTIGGVAASVTSLENVYNAAKVSADSSSRVGQILGRDIHNAAHREENAVVIREAYYEKGLSDYQTIGYMAKFLEVADTMGAYTKEFTSAEFAESMGPFFKQDTDGENDGYPLLTNPFEGDGTLDAPFLLQDKDDVLYFNRLLTDSVYVELYNDKHFKLTADVEFDSLEWTPLGIFPRDFSYTGFDGVFDGGGHTISGLVIKSDTAGFFAVANHASIFNFGIKNSSVQGEVAGGIVGAVKVDGTIENCWNDNTSVYGASSAGGLVGGKVLDSSSDLKLIFDRTYNTGTIRGKGYVGGIIGKHVANTIVTNSFNRGVVEYAGLPEYKHWLGGIIGDDVGSIRYTYNVGEVRDYGTITHTLISSNSYDINETNARLRDDDIDPFGLTEEEMRSKEFAERMGEAFVYDSKNQNDGYPMLASDLVKPSSVAIPRNIVPKVNSSLKVAASMRSLFVSGLVPGESLAIVNMKGEKVWLGRATSSSQVLPVKNPGVYVVATKSRAIRVLVK
ncbi:MAG: hypothetical protein MJY99_11835 [Fibrobacter sp.]|nr:hypothetical protein [Fibrobacter sp.]